MNLPSRLVLAFVLTIWMLAGLSRPAQAVLRDDDPLEENPAPRPVTAPILLSMYTDHCKTDVAAAGHDFDAATWCALMDGFVASQYAPDMDWLWNELNYYLYLHGFRGLPAENFVIGDKTTEARFKAEKSGRFDTAYAIPPDYMDKLAYLPPQEAALISLPELKPYQIANPNAEQYLNLSAVLGEESGATPAHYNLCGPVSLLAVTGTSVPDYFKSLAEQRWGWVKEFLESGRKGMGYGGVRQSLEMLDWEAEVYPDQFRESCAVDGRQERDIALCQLKNWLRSGYYALVVGNLMTAYGVIAPASYAAGENTRNVDHWVAVLAVIDSQDGETYVRVYNSFMNREEIYLWEDFFRTWYGEKSHPVTVITRPERP